MTTYRHLGIFFLFAVLFVFPFSYSQAQTTLNWAKHFNGGHGGVGMNRINSVEVDKAGNAAVCGYFKERITIDDQVYEAVDFGVFIVKFDPTGQPLWSKAFNAPLVSYQSQLFLDSDGNYYFSGQLQNGSIDFSHGTDDDGHATLHGTNVFFICKFNQEGVFQWVKAVPGLAILSHDHFYINGSGNLYKLDLKAELVWERPGIRNHRKIGITASEGGTIWIAGDFRANTLRVGEEHTLGLTASGNEDVFLAKFGPSGDCEMVKSISGASSNVFNDVIAVDDENVVITGGFQGRLNLDTDNSDHMVSSRGHYDMFVSEYNGNLEMVWGHSIGSSGWDDGRALALDNNGQIYLTGAFQFTVDFDPGPGQANLSTPPACVSNIYLLKLDENGNYMDALRFGNNRLGYGHSLSVFSNHLFLAGDFEGPVDFSPLPGQSTIFSASGRDQFLLQLKDFSPMAKLPQSIVMDDFPPISYANESFELNAAASSGLPVACSSADPTVATIVNGTVMVHGAGTTEITISQKGNHLYEASLTVSQVLEVSKAPLTVTTGDYSRAAGEPNPQFAMDYSGWVRGDGPGQIKTLPQASVAADQNSLPGEYDIALSGGVDENYKFECIPGRLTIQKESQNIVFEAFPGVNYGDANVLPPAQSSSGLPLVYTSSNPTVARVEKGDLVILGAGATTITVSQEGNDWYEAAPEEAQVLTVKKAMLTVTARDAEREEGLPNPAFVLDYAGWVGDDGPGDLAGRPTTITSADEFSLPGSYPLQVDGGLDDNYTFSYQAGTLVIRPRVVTSLDNLSDARSVAYPNPTQGLLNIKLPDNIHHGLLRLYDPLGTFLTSYELAGPTKLGLERYPKGVYLLEIISGDYHQVVRVAKD